MCSPRHHSLTFTLIHRRRLSPLLSRLSLLSLSRPGHSHHLIHPPPPGTRIILLLVLHQHPLPDIHPQKVKRKACRASIEPTQGKATSSPPQQSTVSAFIPSEPHRISCHLPSAIFHLAWIILSSSLSRTAPPALSLAPLFRRLVRLDSLAPSHSTSPSAISHRNSLCHLILFASSPLLFLTSRATMSKLPNHGIFTRAAASSGRASILLAKQQKAHSGPHRSVSGASNSCSSTAFSNSQSNASAIGGPSRPTTPPHSPPSTSSNPSSSVIIRAGPGPLSHHRSLHFWAPGSSAGSSSSASASAGGPASGSGSGGPGYYVPPKSGGGGNSGSFLDPAPAKQRPTSSNGPGGQTVGADGAGLHSHPQGPAGQATEVFVGGLDGQSSSPLDVFPGDQSWNGDIGFFSTGGSAFGPENAEQAGGSSSNGAASGSGSNGGGSGGMRPTYSTSFTDAPPPPPSQPPAHAQSGPSNHNSGSHGPGSASSSASPDNGSNTPNGPSSASSGALSARSDRNGAHQRAPAAPHPGLPPLWARAFSIPRAPRRPSFTFDHGAYGIPKRHPLAGPSSAQRRNGKGKERAKGGSSAGSMLAAAADFLAGPQVPEARPKEGEKGTPVSGPQMPRDKRGGAWPLRENGRIVKERLHSVPVGEDAYFLRSVSTSACSCRKPFAQSKG